MHSPVCLVLWSPCGGEISPRALDSLDRMEQRALGRTGLRVSRLGLGTMTWGRDTDEHEAARAAHALRRGRRHAGRHRRGLRRRRERGGPRRAARLGRPPVATWSSPPRLASLASATAPGRWTRPGARSWTPSTPRWLGSAPTTSTSGRSTPGAPRRRSRRPSRALDAAVRQRPDALRGHLQLLRLADRPGRDLAAGLAGPGADRQHAGGVLAAAARHRARGRCPRARRSAWACSPGHRSGAACSPGKYRGGIPADSRAASPHFASFVEPFLTGTSQRIVDGRGDRRRGSRAVPARGRPGLGPRPAGRHRADRGSPYGRPAQRASCRSRTSSCPTRSWPRSTRSPRRRTGYPDDTRSEPDAVARGSLIMGHAANGHGVRGHRAALSPGHHA